MEREKKDSIQKNPSQPRETEMVSDSIPNTNKSKCWVVTGPDFTPGQVMTAQLNRTVEI